MIELKRSYDKKESVPESALPLFKEQDGKFILDATIEGMAPSSAITEFRENNIKLTRERDELKTKFEGIDPDQARKDREIALKVEDGKLTDTSKVEERVTKRTEEMRLKHEKDLKAAKDRADTLTTQLHKAVVETKLLEAAVPFGLKKGADVALLKMSDGAFVIDETGEAHAVEADGKTPRYNAEGKKMSPKDFVESLARGNGRFLFEDNEGGGGSPGDRQSSGKRQDAGDIDYWDKEKGTWNIYEQGKLYTSDPAKAVRMAAKHGMTLPMPAKT